MANIVQQANFIGGGTGTFSSPVTAGNTIIVACASAGTAGPVTDDHSQTYTKVAEQTNDGTCAIYYCLNSVAGVTVVTATNGGTIGQIYEIVSSTFNTSNGTTGSGSSLVGPAISDSGVYISIGITDAIEASVSSVSSPWNLDFHSSFSDGEFGNASIDGSNGSQTPTFTATGSGNYAVSAAGFSIGPAPPPSTRYPFNFTFQKASGEPLAGGRMDLRISQDARDSTDDIQVCAGKIVSTALDGNGSCTVFLYPNDRLSPSTTVYMVKAYSSIGQLVWQGEYSLTSANSFFLLQEDGVSLFLLEDGSGAILLEAAP